MSLVRMPCLGIKVGCLANGNACGLLSDANANRSYNHRGHLAAIGAFAADAGIAMHKADHATPRVTRAPHEMGNFASFTSSWCKTVVVKYIAESKFCSQRLV